MTAQESNLGAGRPAENPPAENQLRQAQPAEVLAESPFCEAAGGGRMAAVLATVTAPEVPLANNGPPRQAWWRECPLDFSKSASLQYHAIVLAVAVVVCLLARFMAIQNGSQVLYPFSRTALPELCQWKQVFGFGCPGCGLTRSFISMAHGQLQQAWSYNPASWLAFSFVLFQIPYRIFQLWRVERTGLSWWHPVMGLLPWVVMGSIFLQWTVRLIFSGSSFR